MHVQFNPNLQGNKRRDLRTSMFVMAAIYSPSGSAPVKIRDMCSGGALIEGAVIPPHATLVRLSKGSLSVTGEVVWCKDGRAGLMFNSAVLVSDWLPQGRAIGPQQRVDEIVQQIKAAGAGASQGRGSAPNTPASCRVSPVELAKGKEALEALANALSEEPGFVELHAEKLQALDMVAHLLGKLAVEEMAAPDRAELAS